MNDFKFTFSINIYDKDGDIIDNGYFIHNSNTIIKVADDLEGLDKFLEQMQNIVTEIRDYR